MKTKKDWLTSIVSPFLWLVLCLCLTSAMAQAPAAGVQTSVDSGLVLPFDGYSPLLVSIRKDTVRKKDSIRPAYLQILDSSLRVTAVVLPPQRVLKPFFKPHQLTAKSFQNQSLPWQGHEVAFVILLFCFVLLAGAQYAYGKRLTQVLRACINERYMAQLVRNGDLYNERISLYLFLVFLLSVPLLVLEVNRHYLNYTLPEGNLGMASTYLLILGMFSLLYGLKILALRIAGVIFKTYAATQSYTLTLFVFNLAEGLIITIFSVLVVFTDSFLLLQLCLLFLALLFSYRLFRAFLLGLSESKYSITYLLLFFCSVEVLPVIVLVKVVMKYFPA